MCKVVNTLIFEPNIPFLYVYTLYMCANTLCIIYILHYEKYYVRTCRCTCISSMCMDIGHFILYVHLYMYIMYMYTIFLEWSPL